MRGAMHMLGLVSTYVVATPPSLQLSTVAAAVNRPSLLLLGDSRDRHVYHTAVADFCDVAHTFALFEQTVACVTGMLYGFHKLLLALTKGHLLCGKERLPDAIASRKDTESVMREFKNLLVLMLTWTVFACSGGGGGSSGSVPASPPPTSSDDFQVSGSVGDGPIVNGTITAVDAGGNTVATAVSDARANYSIDIPADAALPVTISVTGGTDLVTNRPADFELLSLTNVVGAQTVNVSPLTTLVVRAAQCVNDTSDSRIADLRQSVHDQVGMGLDVAVFGDPMRDRVGATNVETAVLANEALGEWVRRIGAAMSSAGMSTSLDSVVETLACDLADGTMDGQVAASVGANDDRVLAVAKAAEATVIAPLVIRLFR